MRTTLAVLSLAVIAWAAQAFWLQDHSLPRYDPTRFVAIAIAASILVYAALSAGMERVEGRERFVYPLLGLVLWGISVGRLLPGRPADSMFALVMAILPAILFVKAVQLVARDAELREKEASSLPEGPKV